MPSRLRHHEQAAQHIAHGISTEVLRVIAAYIETPLGIMMAVGMKAKSTQESEEIRRFYRGL
jgi:hypothetical protein